MNNMSRGTDDNENEEEELRFAVELGYVESVDRALQNGFSPNVEVADDEKKPKIVAILCGSGACDVLLRQSSPPPCLLLTWLLVQ